jgi:nucleoside-diphosphate-sugar epimerase
MKNNHILVTGSSGFIGSAIVSSLIESGRHVRPTSRSSIGKLTNEFGLPVTRFDVIEDIDANKEVFHGIKTLIHCATPNDIQSREANGGMPLAVSGTFRLINEAIRHGIKRIIFLSTLQVYGTELTGVVNELSPILCESAYGLNHYLGEEICRLAARLHGIDIVVLRPSNVYGVPLVSTVSRSTLVPMCFIAEAFNEGSLTIRSSGLQRRNFVSLYEVSTTIERILDRFPKGFNVLNVVSAWHPTILEIAQMVIKIWNNNKDKPIELKILSDMPNYSNEFTVSSNSFKPIFQKIKSVNHMEKVIFSLIKTG